MASKSQLKILRKYLQKEKLEQFEKHPENYLGWQNIFFSKNSL